MLGAVLVVVGLITVGGWLLLHLLRQNGRLMIRMDALEQTLEAGGAIPVPAAHVGFPLGAPAPNFQLPGLDGGALSLETLRTAHQPVMLIFSDPNCGPCMALLPEVDR